MGKREPVEMTTPTVLTPQDEMSVREEGCEETSLPELGAGFVGDGARRFGSFPNACECVSFFVESVT